MSDPKIYDLSISNESLDSDESLKTAITLSLLTWARAQPDDQIPDPSDRKGWWGDTYSDVPGDSFGSRLWTLTGRPLTPELMALAEQLTREALQWMVDDNIVSGFDISLEIVAHGILGVRVGVLRPAQTTVTPIGLWEISLNAV